MSCYYCSNNLLAQIHLLTSAFDVLSVLGHFLDDRFGFNFASISKPLESMLELALCRHCACSWLFVVEGIFSFG